MDGYNNLIHYILLENVMFIIEYIIIQNLASTLEIFAVVC